MAKTRLELTVEMDPRSLLDQAELPGLVSQLAAHLSPVQWALLELLALEVTRQSAVDRETRRQVLQLPHRVL